MNIRRIRWLAVLVAGLLPCSACTKPALEPGLPKASGPQRPAADTWSAPPKLIVDLKKTPFDDRTQIDLEITNDSPHRLNVLEADLECYNLGRELTAKAPVVVRDLSPEESRRLESLTLEVESLEIASSAFVVKRAINDMGDSVVFEVVWRK